MIGLRWLLVACCTVIALPRATDAQRPLAIRRGLPVGAARPACPAVPAARPTADAQRRAARDLAQRAQQSAILGDRTAARDQLRQASTLDPTSPELAYQLARAQESVGAPTEALAEYCRFVALAPSAPDAADARERIATLGRSTPATVPERIVAPFRTGIAAYEAGRMPQAEAGFSAAIALQPDWPDAWYDRALTHVARGQREPALRDFQQYLRLAPEAEDRGQVYAKMSELRGTLLSPGTALAAGLVIPGAGQFYTRRKALGIATAAITAGTLVFALKSDPVVESYEATALDPFGQPYTYTATRTVVGRPYLKRGLAGVGVIAIVSAVEAATYARYLNSHEPRLSASILPSANGLSLALTVRAGP